MSQTVPPPNQSSKYSVKRLGWLGNKLIEASKVIGLNFEITPEELERAGIQLDREPSDYGERGKFIEGES